ncbi:hypothetical protein [Microvirga alba]|uniref:Exosortase/archaeosortase family protein n=1 Tax=Microvirga alba TaxID=2791025 RepID=A0A931BSM3_9HYPH|nr:hypothetical protein [Microvirga alba]MBF9233913.1 hypothetical protein [Microvirga alba]
MRRATGSSVSRNELFAGLVVVGFANGISERVIASVTENGATAALLSTFDISVIVWGALAIAVAFLLRSPAQSISHLDRVVTTCALIAFLTPIAPLSWLAMSVLAIYILRTSVNPTFLHRGAWILLALTIPMFWGRLLFAMLSDLILQGDAALVGWVLGTPRVGNAIQFADGEGYLWIAPACSSLANISLAILCWVTLGKVLGRPSSLRDIVWVLVACAAVVAINVTRISLIGLYREHFELIHGPVGSTVASWIILAVTVGVCLIGMRRELPARI